MRTLLFLDITGVLACSQCGPNDSCGHFRNLGRIVDSLDCDIVLTSSYRFDATAMARLRQRFAEHGIPDWIGVTPDLPGERWTEIRQWVTDHGAGQDRLVIIDDGDDADLPSRDPGFRECHFFRADFHRGLDASLAAAVLSHVRSSKSTP